jgi:hypothetical protein
MGDDEAVLFNGASGEDLRYYAKEGMFNELKSRLAQVANTASVDDLGISPLMYAVWNGHAECVKLLVANHYGVDREGSRCDALYLQTNLGYTALHLAALDCPSWAVKEICFWLMLTMKHLDDRCGDGRTAFEIARDTQNAPFIALYEQFTSSNLDVEFRNRCNLSRDTLAKVTYKMPDIPPRPRLKYALPELEEDDIRRTKRLPPATLLQDREVLPLAQHAVESMRGPQALRCLKFTLAQAEKNADRRINLVHKFDPATSALAIDQLDD